MCKSLNLAALTITFAFLALCQFGCTKQREVDSTFMIDRNGLVYFGGESTPYTGTVVKRENGIIALSLEYKDGLIDGKLTEFRVDSGGTYRHYVVKGDAILSYKYYTKSGEEISNDLRRVLTEFSGLGWEGRVDDTSTKAFNRYGYGTLFTYDFEPDGTYVRGINENALWGRTWKYSDGTWRLDGKTVILSNHPDEVLEIVHDAGMPYVLEAGWALSAKGIKFSNKNRIH